jgi:hypothetical protein
MRRFFFAALLFAAGTPALAQTTELNILAPGVVYNSGIQDLAADYTK